MKPQNATQLRESDVATLEQKLSDAWENLRKLRDRKVTRQLEDNVSVRIARRDVARIETILKEKKKAASGNEGATKQPEKAKAAAGAKE